MNETTSVAMALVFKSGKELTLLEKKNKDKWELESKAKVWNGKRKTWAISASQTGYLGPTVREVFLNLNDEVQSMKYF